MGNDYRSPPNSQRRAPVPSVSIPAANREPTLALDDAEVQAAVQKLRGTPFTAQAGGTPQPATGRGGLPFEDGQAVHHVSKPTADMDATISPHRAHNAMARAMTAAGYQARPAQAPLPPIPPEPSSHSFRDALPPALPPPAQPPPSTALPPAPPPPSTALPPAPPLPSAARPQAPPPSTAMPPASPSRDLPPLSAQPKTTPPPPPTARALPAFTHAAAPAAQALPAFTRTAAPAALQPVKAKPVDIRPPDPLGGTAPAVAIAPPTSQPQVAPHQAGLSNRIAAQELLQLIWFDPKAVPRMRRQQDWRRILDQLEEQHQDSIVDDVTLDDEAMDIEDYTDTFELLSHAAAQQLRSLSSIVDQGRTKDGKFVAPLALFAGQLQFPFSHLENLKATISTTRPFASSDEALSTAIEEASTVIATPDLIAAPEVLRSHTKRITDAFRRVDRLVSKNYIETQNQRALLEGRHYQRRKVFGAEHIQAQLQSSYERRNAVPTYLPAALAEKLPMFEQFQVRIIATVEPAASQYEEHAVALKVAALGRVWRPKW